MPVIFNSMYDALKQCESTDVCDQTYDDTICWDICDDMDGIESKCMTEIQKRTDIIEYQPPYSTIADIQTFVKEHIEILYEISQKHRYPIPDADPENDDSVYYGVMLINAMMQGYATEDEYQKLYDHLTN